MSRVQIKLDFDNKDVRNGHKVGKRLAEVEKYLGIQPKKFKVRETQKGFHVLIEAESKVDLNPEAIAFIQLYLGSDRYRELNNVRRILSYRSIGVQPTKWNVLFAGKRKHNGEVSTEKPSELAKEFEKRLLESLERWRVKLASG
jgi:hypothetical protein